MGCHNSVDMLKSVVDALIGSRSSWVYGVSRIEFTYLHICQLVADTNITQAWLGSTGGIGRTCTRLLEVS